MGVMQCGEVLDYLPFDGIAEPATSVLFDLGQDRGAPTHA
jgi:hypothetical protein